MAGTALLDVRTGAIEEVYVGFNTPRDKIKRMNEVVGTGERM